MSVSAGDVNVTMLSRTAVDVGVTWVSRYVSQTRHHVVFPVSMLGTRKVRWFTLCEQSKAVREYKGWLEVVVDCSSCKKALR